MRFLTYALLLVALLACGQNPNPPVKAAGYQIAFQFSPSVESRFRSSFEAAGKRWEGIITGDQADIDKPVPASECLNGFPDVPAVDDVVILVDTFTEGPGDLLGQAGPCFTRLSNNLTLVGIMRFDTADLDRLAQKSQLEGTIVHEMGHVLGVGTLWEEKGLVQLANSNRNPQTECDTNPQYIGAKGKLEWQKLGRSGNVPLEKGYGTGTCEGHWDEDTLKNELMTGFLDVGTNPLSRLSIASLEDLGYTVNYVPADAYGLLTAPIGLSPQRVRDHQHTELLEPIGSL
jgi:hypothetical protein